MSPRPRRRSGWSVAWLVMFAALSASPLALAAPKRIGVVQFTGPGSAKTQRLVIKMIEKHRLKVMPVTDGPAADDSPSEDGKARDAAARGNLIGIVSGVLVGKGKSMTATIFLRGGTEGEVVKQKTWSSKKGAVLLIRNVYRGFWPVFGKAIGPLRPPPKTPREDHPPVASTTVPPPKSEPTKRETTEPETPAPERPNVAAGPTPRLAPHADAVAERPAETETEQPAAVSAYGPRAVEIAVGPRMAGRNFSYRNVPGQNLGEFRTGRPAGALGFAASWFPRLASPRLGVSVEGQVGARLQATLGDGLYELRSNEVVGSGWVGFATHWATLDLGAGGGVHQNRIVALDDVAAQVVPIPDVNYSFLHTGARVRFYTGTPLGLVIGGSYRQVLGAGAIASQDWFPNLSVYGADALLAATYRIVPWLEARLQGDGRYYRFHMNTNYGDPRVAGGAVDQYWGAWLGLAGVFGGAAAP